MTGPNNGEIRFGHRIAPWIALFLLALLPHLPGLRGGFHSDDEGLIRDNPQLASWEGLAEIWSGEGNPDYWPLTYTGFWIERQLWGENPLPYHLTRILWHAANALLLFALLRRLGIPGAWATAALWAMHPVTVDSVAWLIELKNLLCLFFALISILAYLDFTEGKGRAALALSLLAYALTLLSKSALVALPAIFVLLRRPPRWRVLVPFAAIALGCALVTLRFQAGQIAESGGEGLDFLQRTGLAARNFCFYLGNTFFPMGLSFEYPRIEPSGTDFLWLLPPGLIVGMLVWQRSRGNLAAPWGLRGLGIYALALAPALGFVDLYFFRFSFAADRWQYFALPVPIVLVCAGIATMLQARSAHRAWPCALFLATSAFLGTLAWQRSSLYQSSERLWEATLRTNPQAAMSHAGLGEERLRQGRIGEAAAHFGEAARIQPRFLEASDRLALALERLEKFDEAESVWKDLLKRAPQFAPANLHFAKFLAARGRASEAVPLLESMTQRFPNWGEGHLLLGAALLDSGLKDRAALSLWKAENLLSPGDPLRGSLQEYKKRLSP